MIYLVEEIVPANLTPPVLAAEQRYKEAATEKAKAGQIAQ
jgi:hypothetical protein